MYKFKKKYHSSKNSICNKKLAVTLSLNMSSKEKTTYSRQSAIGKHYVEPSNSTGNQTHMHHHTDVECRLPYANTHMHVQTHAHACKF